MSGEDVAVRAAKEAGKLLMDHFKKITDFEYKEGRDIVTKVDKESERLILKILKSRYLNHNYISEEVGKEDNKSDHTWVIDPLDGTINFVSGIPFFSVSIGLLLKGKPVLGVVYDPVREELFVTEKGEGTTLNGKPVKVSEKNDLKDSVVSYYAGMGKGNIEKSSKFLPRLYNSCRGVRSLGSCALAMAYISCGRIEGYISMEEYPWDVVAGFLMVKEGGGTVTDLRGKGIDVEKKKLGIIASNGKLHKKLLKIVKGKRWEIKLTLRSK